MRGEGAGNVFFMVSHPRHLGGGLAGLLSVRRLMGRPVSLDDLRRDRKGGREAPSDHENHEANLTLVSLFLKVPPASSRRF